MRFRSFGFKASLIAAVVVSLLLSLSVASFFSYIFIKEQVSERLVNDLHAEMAEEANDILSLFQRAENAVSDLRKMHEDKKFSTAELPAILAMSATVGGVSKFTLGLEDGSSYVSRPSGSFPNGVGIKSKYDPRIRPWYQDAMASPGLSHSKPFFTKKGDPMLAVTHTIKHGSLNGVLSADLRFSNLQSRLESLREEKQMISFIVDKSGLIIASTIEEIVPKENIADSSFAEFAETLADAHGEALDYDVNGITMLFIDENIPLINGGEWDLVVAVDKDKAYAPVAVATGKLLLVMFVTAIISILVLIYLMSIIYRPILSLRSIITGLSQGNGDLTQRLEVKTQDDIGHIAMGVNKFIESLQSMMKEVQDSTYHLSERVERINMQSKENAQVLDQHVAETEQIVTAVEELSSTAAMVAEHTHAAASSTREANDNSQNANQSIKKAQGKIETLASDILQATDNVNKMSEETNSIQSIVKVIGDIAEQTNLLALNASIEAARAGEQGRGFAVVADEVRTLANRTQDSTTEIGQAIDSLQKEADTVVSSITHTQSTCEQTVAEAESVSGDLNTLSEHISGVNDLNTEISTSAEEQSKVIQTISENLTELSGMVDKLSGIGKEQYEEVRQISDINDQLTNMISRFKL